MTEISSLPTISEASSSSESRLRSTKRKLDDAFQVLDSAVTPNPITVDRPSLPKRSNTIRSLYSTLAKYGVKSAAPNKVSSIPNTKSTPHLTAILSRAASKTKNTFTFKFSASTPTTGTLLPPTAEYRPSSLTSFLSRLATFKLATYANKPSSIDAVAASKCGWINDGKDRLVCGLCNASWVLAGREGLNRDAANSLIEKQRVGLVESHKVGCPWRTRQCDDSIYCIPLSSPTTMIKDIKSKAIAMDPLIKDILIKHPLTASQLASLHSTVISYTQPTRPAPESTNEEEIQRSSTTPPQPSDNAILASLFGWNFVPPSLPDPVRRVSLSRANSMAPSAPPSPALSRASSVSLPHTSPKRPRLSTSTDISLRLPTNLTTKSENALLQCDLCQRRIGLWAFSLRTADDDANTVVASPTNQNMSDDTPSTPGPDSRPKKALPRRSLDLLKEHRSYCPYVVRSTVVPAFPSSQTPATPGKTTSSNGHGSRLSLSQFNSRNGVPGALEGWRAVLTVILRYGMVQKQRIEYSFLAPKDPNHEMDDSDNMDVDSVKAMVTGVKARGGKDLLKYVKGLLG